MRRGFIFTLDALLALILVMTVIAGIAGITSDATSVYVSQMWGENQQIAESMLETMRTVPLDNLVPPEKINEWISGNDPVLDLTYVDPQMPPLQIVATYWALSEKDPKFKTKAEEIMGYLLQNLAKGYKYQLIINNYTSPYLTFDNSYENANDVGSATITVSGYLFNKTPRGYVAKAYLTKLVIQQEKLVGIQRVLAGGYYCSQPVPTSYYNDYPLTVSSLYLDYQTVPGDENTVQSGRFQLSGSYSGGSVSVDDDLSGWSVHYYFNRRWYVKKIVLTNDAESIEIYTSYNSGDNPELYDVWAIVYEDASGNTATIYLNSGVYVEVTWSGWYISSSRTYTTVPSISNAVYKVPVYIYECYYTADNSLDIKFNVELPDDVYPIEGILSVYTRKFSNTFDYIKFNNKTWKNTKGELDIPLNEIKPDNRVELKVSRYDSAKETGLGSGSWISLKYRTSTPRADDPGLVKLYTITSKGTGIYYLNSLFVPGNVTGINMKLTVEGVHEVRVYYSNGTALKLIYENTALDGSKTTVTIDNSTLAGSLTSYISLRELSKRNFNLIIMLDAYYDPTENRVVRYAGQDYHYEWNNQRILYGYPDSYIKITYIPKVTTTRFMIPIEGIHKLASDVDTEMHFSYYLPGKAQPWYVDVWTGIIYTPGVINPSKNIVLKEGPYQQEFLRFPLDTYLIRVAYTKIADYIMVNGSTNRFKIESNDGEYTFRDDVSRAIVHYFLNGYAPYGDIFTYYAQDNACGYNLTYYYDLGDGPQKGTVLIGNCPPASKPKSIMAYELQPKTYALDDAIYRLFVQLGAEKNSNYLPGTEENPIRIELKGLAGKAIGVKNVPTSGEAIEVTLRIWRGS